MSDNLPDEVVAEILCRLPVKSIIQCTCVCKSWNSVIKNPHFISTHLHKTLSFTKIRDRPLFFHQLRKGYDDSRYRLRFDSEDLDKYVSLHPPFDTDVPFEVVGSCNGVICLFDNEFSSRRCAHNLILWNPSIRKSLLLPSPSIFLIGGPRVRHYHFSNLGFDSRTCDYKVLRIMNVRVDNVMQLRGELYSLNSNSWKDISESIPNYSLGHSVTTVFVNDASHWIVKVSRNFNYSPIENFEGNLVAIFDFRDEVFRHILLPECLVNVSNPSNLNVKVFGESSIAVVHCHPSSCEMHYVPSYCGMDCDRSYCSIVSHIWVMKEYGVVTSWVKLGSVGEPCRGPSKMLEFRNEEEVLIQFCRQGLASQSITSQCIKIFKGYRRITSHFYRYVESLALLDKGDDAGNARYAKGEGSSSKKTKSMLEHATDIFSSEST